MNKGVLLSVAFITPKRSRLNSVARVGPRVSFGEQRIAREVKNWRKIPEKITLKPRKRFPTTSLI